MPAPPGCCMTHELDAAHAAPLLVGGRNAGTEAHCAGDGGRWSAVQPAWWQQGHQRHAAASFATAPCPLRHGPARRQARQPRQRTAAACTAGFACISNAAAAEAPVHRVSPQGPGRALRLHAEELRAAAEARAEQEKQRQAAERKQRQRERAASARQERQAVVVLEGVNHVKHMAAGALAACVSRTLVAPFERVKMECILRQRGARASAVAMGVLRNEGVRGFWRGNGLNILRTAPYKAVNFSSYDAFRKLMQLHSGSATLGRLGSFGAGALAGITAMLTCFPLDVVRTRIMAAPLGAAMPPPLALLRDISRSEGAGALYAGVLPALISVAPSGAVFYGTYDLLKERHLAAAARKSGQPQRSLGTAAMLLYGGVAGVAAETAVYPLQIVQRYMQVNSKAGHHATALSARHALRLAAMPGFPQAVARAVLQFVDAAAAVHRTQGPRGFYAGVLPNLMQVLPNAALSYYAYEAFKRLLAAED